MACLDLSLALFVHITYHAIMPCYASSTDATGFIHLALILNNEIYINIYTNYTKYRIYSRISRPAYKSKTKKIDTFLTKIGQKMFYLIMILSSYKHL